MATASVSTMTTGAATTLARRAQVVRRPGGQVVVILFGRDALSAAASWRSRGYQVDPIDGEALGF